jgi:hypothetical protein
LAPEGRDAVRTIGGSRTSTKDVAGERMLGGR